MNALDPRALCPICAEPFKAGDTCATDIELGICHAACLEGSPTVDLETGEPVDGPILTYPYEEDASTPDATPVDKWEIDRSTDSPILMYEKCSVIQDEQALYLFDLIQKAALSQPQAGEPVAWMNPDHIGAYLNGDRDGIAWSSPVRTDFYSVPMFLWPEKAEALVATDQNAVANEASATLASPQPANPAPPCSTIPENTTKETDMPKLTSKIALELVTRIEALNDQIAEVYREANDYDGINNGNVIRDIVKAREEANDQKCISNGILEALDLDEDEE